MTQADYDAFMAGEPLPPEPAKPRKAKTPKLEDKPAEPSHVVQETARPPASTDTAPKTSKAASDKPATEKRAAEPVCSDYESMVEHYRYDVRLWSEPTIAIALGRIAKVDLDAGKPVPGFKVEGRKPLSADTEIIVDIYEALDVDPVRGPFIAFIYPHGDERGSQRIEIVGLNRQDVELRAQAWIDEQSSREERVEEAKRKRLDGRRAKAAERREKAQDDDDL